MSAADVLDKALDDEGCNDLACSKTCDVLGCWLDRQDTVTW